MTRRWLVLVLAALTGLAIALPASAHGTADRPTPSADLHGRSVNLADINHIDLDTEVEVFVQLDAPAVARYVLDQRAQGNDPGRAAQQKQARAVAAQQDGIRGDLEARGARVLSSLQVGANGLRIKVTVGELDEIAALPGVVSIARVAHHTPSNETSVPWIGAPEVWEDLGFRGEGISIAVIDTGIDYLHANLGGAGDPADYAANDTTIIEPGTFPTAKVIGGYDFAGTLYDAGGSLGPDVPSPDPDPLDVHGHGSHVAGSAAGIGVDGEIGPGVAPDASLYALKVFGDVAGSTALTSDAIEWALDPNGDGSIDDHVDVINMSLGSDFGQPDDPTTLTSDAAAQLGVIVVAAAGNDGDVPYVHGSPAVAPGAISVAASIDGGYSVLGLQVDTPASIAGTYEAAESGIAPSLADVGPISGALAIAEPLDACTPLTNAGDVAGKIALVQRGSCLFSTKHLEAQAAGAVAMVVFNNVSGAPIVMGGDSTGITIPAVMVSLDDGELIKSTIEGSDTVEVTMSADIVIPKPELADTLASFTSRGPAVGNGFKPDLAAPGFGIMSTGVGTGTDGAVSSGTSMATPHVAGLAALMREAHPRQPVSAIKAMLQNSTVPSADVDGALYPLARQGVGVVRAPAAVMLSSYATPGGVSFGRLNPAKVTTYKQRVTVRNLGTSDRTYSVDHVANQTPAGVTVSGPTSVFVPGRARATFEITLTADPAVMDYDDAFNSQTEADGWFILNDGTDELHVGYMAVVDPASVMSARRARTGLTVSNSAGALGWAEGFTLAALDGLLIQGSSFAIDATGYRTGNIAGFDVVQFGVAMDAPWSSMSEGEVDFYLDTDGDGIADYVLVTADVGYLLGIGATGEVWTALFDLSTGSGFLEWPVVTDLNDRVAVLTVDRFGTFGFLTPTQKSFAYTQYAFGIFSGTVDVQVGVVKLDREVIPDLNSFGLFSGSSATMGVSQTGTMLWQFPNNAANSQTKVLSVRAGS